GALADALAVLLDRPAPAKKASRPVVVLMPEPEDEPDEDGDDPGALAAQMQRTLRRAQQTITRAAELVERGHDYGAAVRLLGQLPGGLGDGAMLDAFRQRRDRVDLLRKEIAGATRARRLAGLRDRIEELLELIPNDPSLRRLLAATPWVPG